MYQSTFLSVDKNTTASAARKLHHHTSGPSMRIWLEWRAADGSTMTVSMSDKDAEQLRNQLSRVLNEWCFKEDPLLNDPISWHLRAAKTEEA